MSPLYPLLGLLIRGARYGYELKRVIAEEFDPFWRIDFAQLYRSLDKLKRKGWVHADTQEKGKGPSRQVYSVTERGRIEFAGWLEQPASDQSEFWVKLRLAASTGQPTDALLTAERVRIEREQLARQKTDTLLDHPDPSRFLLSRKARQLTESALDSLALVEAVLPAEKKGAARVKTTPLLITGSDDPLLMHLARAAHSPAHVLGSVGGLLELAQHQADVVGTHLLDIESGEYNIPYVKHLLPEEDVLMVNLAVREYGLMIATGNPRGIRALRDVKTGGTRFINRARGSGARVWLNAKLRATHIDPTSIAGWNRVAATYQGVAAAIAANTADAGPGLRIVASAWGLDFISLGAERYDLVLSHDLYESERGQALLGKLHERAFRREAEALPGYDLGRMGRVIARSKYAHIRSYQ